MDNDSKEENSDWNGFWSYRPSPDDPHEFGECMKDQHDYKWKNKNELYERKNKKMG